MSPHKSLIEQLRAIVTDIREHTLYDYIGAKASTTFPEIDAACAQAADRLEALTAPVEEMETTEEDLDEVDSWLDTWTDDELPMLVPLRHLKADNVRLTAQLAAEKERADAADERAHYATGTAEANIARANEAEARAEKVEAALREALRQVETSRPVNEDINAGPRGKTGMSHLSPYHRDVLDEQC